MGIPTGILLIIKLKEIELREKKKINNLKDLIDIISREKRFNYKIVEKFDSLNLKL